MKNTQITRKLVRFIYIFIVWVIFAALIYCAIRFVDCIDFVGVQWKIFFQYCAITVGVLGSAWIMVALLNHIFGRKIMALIVISFVALYVGGVFAYGGLDGNDLEVLTEKTAAQIIPAINSSLSIFFPSRGDYDPKFDTNLQYHIIHLAGYLFFALLAFSILGSRAIHYTLYLIGRFSKTYIFWNYSTPGLLLAEDIIKKNAWVNVVFVLPHTSKDDEANYKYIFDKIDRLGGIVIYRNMESGKGSKVKGECHFFLTEDQNFNVCKALDVAHRKEDDKRKSNNRKIHLYVRSEMEYVGYLFPSCENIDVDIFNQSDITARQFIQIHPMIDIVPKEKRNGFKVNHNFHVLILGFGWSGREVLNKIICDTQFVDSTFAATIIDNTIKDKHGDYFAVYEDFIQEYNLKFVEDASICKVGSELFFRWFEQNFKQFDRIVVSLGDDNLNIDIGVSIARIIMKHQACRTLDEVKIKSDSELISERLFVQTKDSSKYIYAKYPMTLFGNLKDIYTEEIIIKEQMDSIAKAVNYVYHNHDKGCYLYFDKNDIREMSRLWDNDLSVFNKNSSRAVAMNINNVLKLVGEEQFYLTISNEENISLLADWEHRRWNAFILTKGVGKWNYSIIPQEHPTKAKLYQNQNKQDILLRHACLVPTDELHLVSKRVDDDFIATDKRIVTHFLLFKTTKLK